MRRDYDALRLAKGVTRSATRYIRKKSPYKALEKFSKAVYGTTGGTCSARDFRPVMEFTSVECYIMPPFNHVHMLTETVKTVKQVT